MYANIKSRIKNQEGVSPFFECCAGVRQGENLSPFLFSIFLNDLEHYFNFEHVPGIKCELHSEDIFVFLKLFVLLYADDTVIFGEDPNHLQHALNVFENYCKTWKLKVNVSKTKIIVFGRGRPNQNFHFFFENNEIDIVSEYKYLGIFLSRSGSFRTNKKYLAEQANKALFSLFRKTRSLNLTIDLQIELFNKTVKPILLYGSEIWGFGNLDDLERIQLKFLKFAFNLKRSTPTYMIYGELGVKPISIDIKTRMISFWSKLLSHEGNQVASSMYQIIYDMHKNNIIKSEYLNNIKHILNTCGFSGLWESQSVPNTEWLKLAISQKLEDQYLQNWSSIVDTSTCGTNYRLFKDEFGFSEYLYILPKYFSKILLLFRTRNHRLPIELGRWSGIAINERICHFCHKDIGDEFHYILKCEYFQEERHNYIKPYYRRHPNVMKFKQLMNSTNIIELKKLCKFIQIITASNH